MICLADKDLRTGKDLDKINTDIIKEVCLVTMLT